MCCEYYYIKYLEYVRPLAEGVGGGRERERDESIDIYRIIILDSYIYVLFSSKAPVNNMDIKISTKSPLINFYLHTADAIHHQPSIASNNTGPARRDNEQRN